MNIAAADVAAGVVDTAAAVLAKNAAGLAVALAWNVVVVDLDADLASDSDAEELCCCWGCCNYCYSPAWQYRLLPIHEATMEEEAYSCCLDCPCLRLRVTSTLDFDSAAAVVACETELVQRIAVQIAVADQSLAAAAALRAPGAVAFADVEPALAAAAAFEAAASAHVVAPALAVAEVADADSKT